MNIEDYLKISARKIGSHIGINGEGLSVADYENLWNESLDEFFIAEPLSADARRTLARLDKESRKAYFAQSIFSLERFIALSNETHQAHRH